MLTFFESEDNVPLAGLLFSLFLSTLFTIVGYMVAYQKRYNLISGYNRAPQSVKDQYDIEGLSKHLGDGLITLAVLLTISSVFFWFGLDSWMIGGMGLFTFITLIILIGTRKFMPPRRLPAQRSPSDAKHAFLYSVLPTRLNRAMEAGSRQWQQECRKCGHAQDYWEAGGVRWKAVGEPSQLALCEECGTLRWHKIRKKPEFRK